MGDCRKNPETGEYLCGEYTPHFTRIEKKVDITFTPKIDHPLKECEGVFGFKLIDMPTVIQWIQDTINYYEEKLSEKKTRLIEKAYAAAKEDVKLDWTEVKGKGSNPRIVECYKAVDGLGNPELLDDDGTSWCSCYVNKKIQDAGGRGTRNALARSWLQWGNELKKPVEGCIVVFKRGNSSWQGHVSFFY